MAANVLKQGNFVIGEMVIDLFLNSITSNRFLANYLISSFLMKEEGLILTEIGALIGERRKRFVSQLFIVVHQENLTRFVYFYTS
jgi:hypothetical protein